MLTPLLCCVVALQAPDLTHDYDEVRDVSRTIIKAGPLFDETTTNTNHVEMLLMVESPGGSPGTPTDKVIMALSSINDEWEYLKFNDIALLVDDERTSFTGQVERDSEVKSGLGCYELSFVYLPVELAEQIGSAREAKVAYGTETFILRAPQKGSLANAARIAKDPTALASILEQKERARKEEEERQGRMRIAKLYEDEFNKVEHATRRETRRRDAERILRQGHKKIVEAIEEKYGVKEDELREWVLEYRRRGV